MGQTYWVPKVKYLPVTRRLNGVRKGEVHEGGVRSDFLFVVVVIVAVIAFLYLLGQDSTACYEGTFCP